MAKWYIKRNGNEAGPFETAQLKQLAEKGKVKSDDLIRRDDQEAWHRAESVKGLLSERVEQPPSLNAEMDSVSSYTHSQTSEPRSSNSFGASAQAVGQIAAKKAELIQIQQVTLPEQFAKLGRKIFEGNRMKSEHEGLFAAIQQHYDALDRLTQQGEQQPSGTTIAEKAKSLGSKALIATKIKSEELQRRQKFIQLGEAVSEGQSIPDDCLSEKAGIDRLLQRQKQLSLEIDSVKVTLGRQNRGTSKGLLSWTSSRTLVAAAIIVGFLFLYGLRYRSRQSLEIDQQNLTLSTDTGAGVPSGGGIEELLNAANQITDAVREQGASENRRAIAQAKENKERAEEESERNRQFIERTKAEQKERESEEALRQEKSQKDRLAFIETCLTRISFDTQNIILSKKLRTSGATVELIGKSIPQFNHYISQKDWLGFLKFAENYRLEPPAVPFTFEGYPSQDHVYNRLSDFRKHSLAKTQRLEPWVMHIKTKNQYKIPSIPGYNYTTGESLFAIHLPLSLDRKLFWPHSSSPLIHDTDSKDDIAKFRVNWEKIHGSYDVPKCELTFIKHPDGGYLLDWNPLGIYLVGVSQDYAEEDSGLVQKRYFSEGSQFREKIGGRISRKMEELLTRKSLRQIDDAVFDREVMSEYGQIYNEALVWLNDH